MTKQTVKEIDNENMDVPDGNRIDTCSVNCYGLQRCADADSRCSSLCPADYRNGWDVSCGLFLLRWIWQNITLENMG